jgi:hypothetical protein
VTTDAKQTSTLMLVVRSWILVLVGGVVAAVIGSQHNSAPLPIPTTTPPAITFDDLCNAHFPGTAKMSVSGTAQGTFVSCAKLVLEQPVQADTSQPAELCRDQFGPNAALISKDDATSTIQCGHYDSSQDIQLESYCQGIRPGSKPELSGDSFRCI